MGLENVAPQTLKSLIDVMRIGTMFDCRDEPILKIWPMLITTVMLWLILKLYTFFVWINLNSF